MCPHAGTLKELAWRLAMTEVPLPGMAAQQLALLKLGGIAVEGPRRPKTHAAQCVEIKYE